MCIYTHIYTRIFARASRALDSLMAPEFGHYRATTQSKCSNTLMSHAHINKHGHVDTNRKHAHSPPPSVHALAKHKPPPTHTHTPCITLRTRTHTHTHHSPGARHRTPQSRITKEASRHIDMLTCYGTRAKGIASMHLRACNDTVNIGNTKAKGLERVCNLNDAQKQLLFKKYPQSHLKGL